MTSGELIRTARSRAGYSQAQLAERLSMPRSQIARWELDEVEPGLSTVRRVLQACGFDLSLALVAFEPDEGREARLRDLQRLTPQQRVQRMLDRLDTE
ncbi:MAG: multiprotein-bridging factor 1 family protein [Thermoleophilia bacterium]|jgi:transcriptional regulator with XRE-family HTH domain